MTIDEKEMKPDKESRQPEHEDMTDPDSAGRRSAADRRGTPIDRRKSKGDDRRQREEAQHEEKKPIPYSPSQNPPIQPNSTAPAQKPYYRFKNDRSFAHYFRLYIKPLLFIALIATLVWVIKNNLAEITTFIEKSRIEPVSGDDATQDASQSKDENQSVENLRTRQRANRREYFFTHQSKKYYCSQFLKNCTNIPLILNPYSGQYTAIGEGRALFIRFCKRCHGDSGKGFGQDAYKMTFVPGRLDLAGEGILEKDAYLFWSIAAGGKKLGTKMPAFRDFLTEQQIWKIIAFTDTL